MPKLLSVLVSPRGDYSISRSLAKTFTDEWTSKNAGGEVVTRDLCNTKLPFVDLPWIAGAYSPAEQHSPEMKASLAVGDELIAELQAADHILIATPMFNFSTPAILKAWIDHVVRVNVTVSTSYEGLLKNKKVTVIIASGGVYTPGSYMEAYDRESGYLKAILGFIGLTDVTLIQAGGSNDVAQGKTTQEALVSTFIPEVQAAA